MKLFENESSEFEQKLINEARIFALGKYHFKVCKCFVDISDGLYSVSFREINPVIAGQKVGFDVAISMRMAQSFCDGCGAYIYGQFNKVRNNYANFG